MYTQSDNNVNNRRGKFYGKLLFPDVILVIITDTGWLLKMRVEFVIFDSERFVSKSLLRAVEDLQLSHLV